MLKNPNFENVEKKIKKPVTFLPFLVLIERVQLTFLKQNSLIISGFVTFE